MIRTTTMVITVLVVATGCSLVRSSQPPAPEANEKIRGAELSIRCLGTVQETLYVQIESGSCKERFGVISRGPNGREGGKTAGLGGMVISKGLTVRWGIKNQDGYDMLHHATFELAKHADKMDRVKAVVLVYSGGGQWTLNTYDKHIAWSDKQLVFTERPLTVVNPPWPKQP